MGSSLKTILCVDDDSDNCEMVATLLALAGYQVKTAHTVLDGLNLALAGGFDLYLLDSCYSDGNGLELCRQIRAVDPKTPILFFSGLATEDAKQKALQAGAQGYLVKPTGIKKIESAISELLQRA